MVANDINLPKNADLPSNIKAYGTINFGDSKETVQSKLRDNEIYRNKDTGAYIIRIFDTSFEIEFIYGTNVIKYYRRFRSRNYSFFCF